MAITKTNELIISKLSSYNKKYEKVDSNNGFDEYIVKYNYETWDGGDGYCWKNKYTGEMTDSKFLNLYIWFYDKDWNYYPDGIKESADDWEQILVDPVAAGIEE